MRILCFGDSNTYGYDPRGVFGGRYGAEDRWVDLLARRTGWEFLNAGENGREIPHRDAELQRFDRTLTSAPPIDLLILMLGTNDLLQGQHAPGAAARMETLLQRIPLWWKKVLLVAPPPMKMGLWVEEERLLGDSAELAAQYRALAEKCGAHFADAAGWEIEMTFDGVHFTEAGHRAFAGGMEDALRTLLAGHCAL